MIKDSFAINCPCCLPVLSATFSERFSPKNELKMIPTAAILYHASCYKLDSLQEALIYSLSSAKYDMNL